MENINYFAVRCQGLTEYVLTDGFREYPIRERSIYFYSEDGHIIRLFLEDACGFWLSIRNCKVAAHKKDYAIDYSKGEMVILRVGSQYDILIPIAAVGLTCDNTENYDDNCGYVYEKKTYSFNGSNLQFIDGTSTKIIAVGEDRIAFYISRKCGCTKLLEKAMKLRKEFYSMGIDIGSYELHKILKEYNITKKRK